MGKGGLRTALPRSGPLSSCTAGRAVHWARAARRRQPSGGMMIKRCVRLLPALALFALIGPGSTPAAAAELNPAAAAFRLPDQIEWKQGGNPAGPTPVLVGEPAKPG